MKNISSPKMILVYPSYSKILGRRQYRRYEISAGGRKIPERPHVGLGYLSEALLTNGFDHIVIDMNLLDSYADFKTKVKSYSPDIIGITMVTPGYLKGYQFIKQVKKNFPETKIIVGGPHVGLMREQLLKDCQEIDIGFVSEAEQSLIDYLKNDCNPEKVNGVIYKRKNKIFFNPPKLEENIDKFGFPRYQKFELDRYSDVSLYTSRGCPFKCIFCTVESYRRKGFRPRLVQSIIEEIKYWYAKGQRVFPIEDDNFTLDMGRVFQLCDAIEKLGYKDILFALGQGIRADRVDRKLLKRMFKVGFKYITIPVEAGNNRMLANLNKSEKIETIERTIQNACDIGYEIRLLFVVGAPGETWKDVEDSLRIGARYPVMYTRFNNLLPIPGTKLFDWIKENDLFITPPEKYLNSDNLDCTEALYETPEFTAAERKKAIIESDKLNKKLFYRYLLKKLNKLFLIKYPISYLASRKFFQFLITDYPILYRFALWIRQKTI